MKWVRLWAVFAAALTLLQPHVATANEKTEPAVITSAAAESDWPQWRGPGRTNIAPDTGLLDQWPKDGPPLLWKAAGLGEGVPSVAVARGRVYVLGYRGGSEYLSARDAASGARLWDVQVGPAVAEMRSMRWLSQRTPTVDGERIYVVTARGELICLGTADGAEQWRKDYITDFEGKRGVWGYCDYPLVDGQRLICTPGGPKGGIIALNKSTGELLWQRPLPDYGGSTYSAVIVAEIAGVRQYIQQFNEGAVGIDTNGKVLWVSSAVPARLGNVHTAIVRDDMVFLSAGWGSGAALLKLTRDVDAFKAIEQYRSKSGIFHSWFGNSSLIGEHIYNNSGYCVELKTGTTIWNAKLTDSRTMVVADGHLYYRLTNGTMVLAQATPENYVEKSRFLPPRASRESAWTSPVIAGGRLYLRDQDELLCYDLRKDRSRLFPASTIAALTTRPAVQLAQQKRPRDPVGNDAIFVTTPQDVVVKMLEMAEVKKDDVVYDLGCGDGRIVVTAASKYGCKAVGYDIDPECVRMSRENVQEHKVGNLVEIVQKDVFTLDLSGASVVTIYMGREVNLKLLPQLQKLKPGSRIVSHNFDIEGYAPDKTAQITSSEDDTRHTIYLWVVPLKKSPPR